MQKDLVTSPSFVITRATGGSLARNAMLVIGASILIALSAQIAVPLPMSPVPMTMQPLAILLVGAALGSKRGLAAVLLYLFEGALGVPVFAQGKAGIFWIVAGPTAGYLLAFPVAAYLLGWFAERGVMRTVPGAVLAMVSGIATIQLLGWSWLATAIGLGAMGAFTVGVAPFLLGDLVKLVIAALLFPAAQRWVERC